MSDKERIEALEAGIARLNKLVSDLYAALALAREGVDTDNLLNIPSNEKGTT